jgi:MoxR-like ATPase
MLKLNVSYPTRDDEKQILRRMANSSPDTSIDPVITPDDILRLRKLTDNIYMDEKIEEYIVNIVESTRVPEKYDLDIKQYVRYGASPRATIFLAMASKGNALLKGRGFVTPQDVKDIGMDVLRHRVILSYEAEAEEITPEDVVKKIFDTVQVP